uniref:Uncharacterized protein n=1 Tax=uncultured marine microorganism HF4000_137B17 TaxID=455523 RepID=B3T289_9ZZZZ|nr:hypothetical protein ALOHA_HF4000137B17ctg1g35 [uncultured marine microorganism HF4000_137B17]
MNLPGHDLSDRIQVSRLDGGNNVILAGDRVHGFDSRHRRQRVGHVSRFAHTGLYQNVSLGCHVTASTRVISARVVPKGVSSDRQSCLHSKDWPSCMSI